MAQLDRSSGLVGNAAFKYPCRAATTANITLSAEQTIDGIACVDGDRVLVKNQTTGSENGIWVVSTGSWNRSDDFDGSYDCTTGTMVRCVSGTANANSVWKLDTTGTITIGTTSLTFTAASVGFDAQGMADFIHVATNKATPVNADEVGIWDSVTSLLNRLSFTNLKAFLKTYNDTLYAALAGSASQAFAASTFTGNLTGNVTGNTSGSSGSCTGNAATATNATNAGNLTGTPTFFAPITNSIAGDVTLTNQNQYYIGPTVAQGTTGKWFASGTVSLGTTAGGDVYRAILTDGTTVFASTTVTSNPGLVTTLSLSGFIDTPVASIYIAVANMSRAGATMYANSSTYAKDSTLTAIRVG